MKEQKDRYEIFLKVCETGSFSGAAEALNYTQSGISQMMAGLEEELEVRLFARVKKGVILTDNGARLIPYIQEMVNQKAKLRQAAFNINHKIEGKLRVGSFSSITALWMPGVIHFFKEHYPKVQVEIFDGNYDEIRDWIIHGVAFRAKCKMFSRHLQKPILKTEKGRFNNVYPMSRTFSFLFSKYLDTKFYGIPGFIQ